MAVTKNVRKLSSDSADELLSIDIAERDAQGRKIIDTYATKGEIPTALPADGGNADYATNAGNAGNCNGHTLGCDVPANAKFTDTWRGITVGGTALTSSQTLTISAGTGVTITNNGNGSFTISSSNHVYKGTSSSTIYLSNALFKANHVYEIYPRNGNSTFTVYWRDANNNSVSWTCSKLTVRVISKRTSHSPSYKQAIMLIWGDDFNYGSSNEDYAWFAQPRRQEVYGIQSNFYISGYFNIYDMSN